MKVRIVKILTFHCISTVAGTAMPLHLALAVTKAIGDHPLTPAFLILNNLYES